MLDLIYCVEDDQLDALRVTRGGSLVVSPAEAEKLKSQLHADPVPVVGGSAANVARALASIFSYFPGAPTVRFAGMLGSDATGAIFDEIMRAAGVESSLAVDALFPTAHCICLVSSDGQRTMRTCLGAAAQLSGIEALPGGWLSEASLVHVGALRWRCVALVQVLPPD